MRSVHRQARRGTAVAAGAPAGVPPAALPELNEGTLACRVAGTTLERQWHEAIRAAVFVHEQGLFAGTDLDSRDADPATVKVIGLAGGRPAGAVRLYPLPEPGEWKGDRLAVLPAWRRPGWARRWCASPSVPRVCSAATGWSPWSSPPTCPSSSGSAGNLSGRNG